MAWLRLDDGFTKHPKFEGWTVLQRWAWLEVMEYCARYSTGGRIPKDLSLMPRTTSENLLAKAVESGWLDVREDGTKWIHDWELYNPSEPLEDRVRQALEEHPAASANEIANLVEGRRKAILALVRRIRGTDPEPVWEPPGDESGTALGTDPEPVGDTAQSGSQAVMRASAGASRPVPSPEDQEQEPMRASERELQDAHRSPADEHAGDPDPEPVPVDQLPPPVTAGDDVGAEVRAQLERLRPRGATA